MPRPYRFPVVVAWCAVVFALPRPAGVELQAWRLLALFSGTTLGMILQVMDTGAVALLGLVAAILTGAMTVTAVLGGFSNSSVWLIVSAFLFSNAVVITGLGQRVAYLFIRAFGHKTLALGYAPAASELVMAPAVPAITARAGGILFPILTSIARACGSSPGQSPRRLGGFLMLNQFQATIILSAMFLTSMAANPLIAEMAEKTAGVKITRTMWAGAAGLPGLLSPMVVPWLLCRLHPPEMRESPEAAAEARRRLAGIVGCCLLPWTTTSPHRPDPATIAFLGLAAMLVCGVLTWQEIRKHDRARHRHVPAISRRGRGRGCAASAGGPGSGFPVEPERIPYALLDRSGADLLRGRVRGPGDMVEAGFHRVRGELVDLVRRGAAVLETDRDLVNRPRPGSAACVARNRVLVYLTEGGPHIMAFCTNCGAQAQGAFCPQCGAKIGGAAAGPAPPNAVPPVPPPPMGQPRMSPPPMGPPRMGPAPMGQPHMGPPPMGQPHMGPPPMGQPRMGPPPMGGPPAAAPPPAKGGALKWVLFGCLGLIFLGGLVTAGGIWWVGRKVKQVVDPGLASRNPALAAAKMIATLNPDLEIVSMDEGRGTITIRNRKENKTITFNAEDVKNGKFSFETEEGKTEIQTGGSGQDATVRIKGPDGEMTMGGNVKLPAWLPAYPGAEATGSFGVQSAEKGQGGTVAYKTSDSVEKVAAFYESALRGAGITVTRNSMRTSDSHVITLEGKDASERREAGVTISAQDGATQISLTFQSK